jgi:hypothetical protein
MCTYFIGFHVLLQPATFVFEKRKVEFSSGYIGNLENDLVGIKSNAQL